MNDDMHSLLNRYFDEDLTSDEIQSLQNWLDQDLAHRQTFVEAAILHNQLHGQIQAKLALQVGQLPHDHPPQPMSPLESNPSTSSGYLPFSSSSFPQIIVAGTLVTALVLMFLFLRGTDAAQAGQDELRKVIAASMRESTRAYEIDVESNVIGGAKQKRKSADDTRPPKVPLDGASLHVRGSREFVLQRKTADGRTFITGCDGTVSWMVPPEGPVRISNDLQHFSRDVPGHEFSMSLCNLGDALEQLTNSYVLNALPAEYNDSQSPLATSEPTRLLVATKMRGSPGPRRVEITYLQDSGQIEQLRFVDMPYGPDRLTVRLSSTACESIADEFFQHQSHHESDRKVQSE